MKRNRVALAIIALSMTGLIGTVVSGCSSQTTEEERAARRLDSLLGQGQSPAQTNPRSAPGPRNPQSFLDDWLSEDFPFGGAENNPFFQFNLGANNVEVHETGDAYVIEFPLENPEDEQNIAVNVAPRRIEIQGQVSFGQGGFAGTSSFMKSFTTDEELNPDGVTRKIQDDRLVVTVPKKFPEEPHTPQARTRPETIQPQTRPIPPEVLEDLEEQSRTNDGYI